MMKFFGTYEHSRDSFRSPTFWRLPNNQCLPHFHSALELVYLEKGTMEASVGRESFTVRQGELLIIPSYVVHRFSTPQASDTIVLVIPVDYIANFKRISGEKQFSQLLLPADKAVEQIAYALNLLLDSFNEIKQEPASEYRESFVTRGQIYTILGILMESVPLRDFHGEDSHDPLRDILIYLDKNYSRQISLPTLAKALGYSHSRISHIFNERVGCSIPEYLNALRSRAAAGILLEQDSLSITDTAMQSGFDSMRTFYRAFKKFFGLTPSRFLQLPEMERERLMTGQMSLVIPRESGTNLQAKRLD